MTDTIARTAVLSALALFLAPAAALAQPAPDVTQLLQRAAESRTRGPQNAAVLVYEISDFQCPYCARFATEVYPQIDSAYVRTGRVQWVFVNLPMPSHTNAWHAAEAALCAGATDDRFWPLHHRLFSGQHEWADRADPAPVFERFAREAGVTMDEWQACVLGDRVAAIILQDVIFGSRVTGTPTFIINNQQTIIGIKPFREWQQILDPLLRKR